ncbi:hypothetical protein Asi03nite_14530 [Actinoplanes siamensis]|uniref:histidine kinase n=1 Tax=Actinoplanes siamensis TaxID=1223317 RepID=A0A919N3X1_9ACTN|nr:hypothetical protein Asi03nite_14530 [Actinoplanes siamensis]
MEASVVDQQSGATVSTDEAGRLRATIAVQRELMGCAGDRDAITKLMTDRVLRVLPAGTASVVQMLDADGQRLHPVAWAGPAGGCVAIDVVLPGSLSAVAIRTGGVVRSDDTKTDPRSNGVLHRRCGMRSVIIVPLTGPDRISGVLAVFGDRPGVFGEADEQQLVLLADALSSALRHVDAAARHEQLLRQATSAVAALEQERTATLAALRRVEDSERRFSEVFETSPVAKIVVGLREPGFGRVTVANPAFCRLLGVSPDQAVGMPVARFASAGSDDIVHGLRALAAGDATRLAIESSLRTVSGDQVTVAARASLISDEQGPLSAVVQLLDVTTERAATDRQVQRLRATVAVQNDVTAAASDRNAALRVVAARAVDLFTAADGAVVELLDGDLLRYEAAAGALSTAVSACVPVDGSLSGLVVDTGRPACCGDALTDTRVDRAACARLGIRSMLIAPLRAENTVIGVLKISSAAPHAFDDADEQQLTLLAGSLSSALRHADDAARNATLLADRTRAVADLQISQLRFRLAFENSPLGLIISSLHEDDFGRYLQANPAMATITGYRVDELTTMTVTDLQHPDDAADSLDRMRRLLAGEMDTVAVERRYRHKDGHTVWVFVRVAVVRDEHGNGQYVVNQVEDITAQRAATAQLRRQARLLDLIPAAVIVRDLDGTVDWWNTGASRLYGWPTAVAAGKVTHKLLATLFPAGATADSQRAALLEHGRWEGHMRHLAADGRTVTVLSQQVLHRNGEQAAGTDAQVLEINTDVTATRAAEQALADSEQRLRAHFAHSAAGQIIRGLDGRLIEVNPAYAAMLGYRPEQLVGRRMDDLLHSEDHDQSTSKLAALVVGDVDAYTHEGRLRHVDGHWVDVAATMSLVRDTDGRPRHFVGVVVDISARRAAEQARDIAAAALTERNTQLEAANQLKLDIIGMLGHEIGNPLTSIRGYAELLTEDWPALTDAVRTRAVDAIARQAGRLDDIVREVLAMVTIDAGAITVKRERLSLRSEIVRALAAAEAGDVPVLGPEEDVLFNRGHLQQILVNLLSNAGKYGGGATAIRIVTGDDADRRGIRVRVEDNGRGVPDEFRPQLFERLARAERDAGSVRGTGLGLYIVRGLAHANHADIHHEPNPAGGSVFVLELEPVEG